MTTRSNVKVAILLATYNGARFIEPQIQSLKQNSTPFILHWIDDHSTDGTRDAVRAAARIADIPLCEWHYTHHQGFACAFFHLMECVEADIYFFCDQDDIWQPGKIDASVNNLIPDVGYPVLFCSDPLVFFQEQPGIYRRQSDLLKLKPPAVLEDQRMFVCFPGNGQTFAFTRPLRDVYLTHKEIARSYAYAHDFWINFLAVAVGRRRWLPDAPTTLYRQHGNNFTGFMFSARGISLAQLLRIQQRLRPVLARQAEGFVLASRTLQVTTKVQRLVALAKLFTLIDRRVSAGTIIRLAHHRALWPDKRTAICFAALCLFSHAKKSSKRRGPGVVDPEVRLPNSS